MIGVSEQCSRSLRISFAGSLLVCLSLGAAGCGPTVGTENVPDPLPSADAPVILTEQLSDAFLRTPYAQMLVANGGKAPLIWALVSPPPELSWLALDGATGRLGGVPSQALEPARTFAVKVVDANGAAVEKELHLRVRSCSEGELIPSYSAQQGACLSCSNICGSGAAPCQDTAPSQDPAHCGSACGACGLNANRCADGTCACGATGADCGDLFCCGGGQGDTSKARCVDTSNDLENCGGCQEPCTGKQPSNAVPAACAGGRCQFSCKAGWADCDGNINDPNSKSGCETPLNTLDNCGRCGLRCEPRANASPRCEAQACAWSCNAGFADCNGDLQGPNSDGCETPLYTLDTCRTCGERCTAPENGAVTCDGVAGCVRQCPAETTLLCDNAVCCPIPTGLHATQATCSVTPTGPACRLLCEAGWENCDGASNNGCEVNLMTNVLNCGRCGAECDVLHQTCSNGKCVARPCLRPPC